MPTSFGSTTAGSIFSEMSSSSPVMTAVTMPPPAVPSTRRCLSSSCMRCAACMSSPMSGILKSAIELDLLDGSAERLDHLLGDGVRARLVLVLFSLGLALLGLDFEEGAPGGG